MLVSGMRSNSFLSDHKPSECPKVPAEGSGGSERVSHLDTPSVRPLSRTDEKAPTVWPGLK